MCGITAISRALERSSINDPRAFLRIAALAIEERGRDATGFGWVDSTDHAWYWKQAGRARDAIRHAPLDLDTRLAIGHTRAMTKGKASDNANNHPVVDEGIILVHNGIVSNDWEIYKLFDEDFEKKADVDSQAIASLLAHAAPLGFDHPAEALEMVRGDAAVAWIDHDDPGSLHLARCLGRPMFIGWTRLGDLVMSSTESTLENLALWSNTKIRSIMEVPEGTYLRIVNGEIAEDLAFKPQPKLVTTTTTRVGYVSPYSPHPPQVTSGKAGGGADAVAADEPDDWTLTDPWYERDVGDVVLIYRADTHDVVDYYYRSGQQPPEHALAGVGSYERSFDDGTVLVYNEFGVVVDFYTDPTYLDDLDLLPRGDYQADDEIDWANLVPRRGWKGA